MGKTFALLKIDMINIKDLINQGNNKPSRSFKINFFQQ